MAVRGRAAVVGPRSSGRLMARGRRGEDEGRREGEGEGEREEC